MGKSKSEVSERLNELSEALFSGNNSELARSIDMKPSTFGKYMTGDRLPGARILERISRLGVNVDWLLTGQGKMIWSGDGAKREATLATSMKKLPDHSEHDLYPVPQLQVEVEAGTGAVSYDSDERTTANTEWLSATFIRREYGVPPERVRTLTVRGDSMVNTISPGERVRVALWEGDRMWQRRIYVFNGPFGLTIKRWNSQGDRILLEADNPDVEPRAIPRDVWDADWSVVAWLLEVVKPL